jgi:hypothetical protein
MTAHNLHLESRTTHETNKSVLLYRLYLKASKFVAFWPRIDAFYCSSMELVRVLFWVSIVNEFQRLPVLVAAAAS